MDDLTKMLGQLGGATGATGAGTDPTAALSGLTQAVQSEGGLDGLVEKLRAAGLGGAVDSWISTGENHAVDPAKLGAALGPDTVQRLSSGSGIDIGSLLPMLAAFLPQIINMLTPHGTTPSGGLNGATGGLGDLGGLLGGILGGGTGTPAGSAGGGIEDVLGGLGGLLGGNKGS